MLQTYMPNIPVVRDESDWDISEDMFKNGFKFLPFNFLGIFCICTARDSVLVVTSAVIGSEIQVDVLSFCLRFKCDSSFFRIFLYLRAVHTLTAN